MTPIDPATLRIAPLTRAHAEDLATWAYDAPYDFYDMAGAEPDELLDPAAGFHAVLAALRTVEGLGFERVGSFAASRDGRSFEVLVRPEPR